MRSTDLFGITYIIHLDTKGTIFNAVSVWISSIL
jgi:hypothetical protein